ncbi:hypothetical protein YT1_2345 [Rhodococcus ruber]|nr:hypothetical protein YT1_2345 [Rhodococcus ruber]
MSILTRGRCAYQFERYRLPPSERSGVAVPGASCRYTKFTGGSHAHYTASSLSGDGD